MYSPVLGRFMQTDPVGYGDSPNLYAYVLNDPVNLLDPLGLQCNAAQNIGGCGEIVVTGSRPESEPAVLFPFQIFAFAIPKLTLPAFETVVSSFLFPTPAAARQCPRGLRLNIGFGFGGTLFMGRKGASGGVNLGVSIPLSLWRTGLAGVQGSLSASGSGLIGAGAFYGRGSNFTVGISKRPLTSGTRTEATDVAQAGAAWGKGGEVAVQLSNTAIEGGAVNFGERAGFGAYLAGGRQVSRTAATKELFCKR